MAVIRNTNRNIWCEYCKARYPHGSTKSMAIAAWTLINRNKTKQHLCHDCIAQITHWACNCGQDKTCTNRFPLEDQMNYRTPTLEMSENGI